MKKILVFSILVISFLFFSSCESMNKPSPGYDIFISAEKGGEIADLEIVPIWKKGTLEYAVAGLDSFAITVKNKTDSVIRVLWEESSISYGGSSYIPFVSGQKFINAGMPAAPMIIPRGVSSTKTVHSSGQVYYSDDEFTGGWKLKRINSNNIILVFCIESEGAKEFYTVDVREQGI